MPRIVAVTTEDELLEVFWKSGEPVEYSDVGDAAGDLDGGDYRGWLSKQHPGKNIKEFRIVLDKLVKT